TVDAGYLRPQDHSPAAQEVGRSRAKAWRGNFRRRKDHLSSRHWRPDAGADSPVQRNGKMGLDGPCLFFATVIVYFPSGTRRRANDFYRALGMASDEFCHAAEQETLDACLPMRTNDDQIGMPLGCIIDDRLSNVTYLDGGVNLESCALQLLRNPLDQLTGWLLLIIQLGSVAWRHLRWGRRTRLQHMQDSDLCILSPKLRDNSL